TPLAPRRCNMPPAVYPRPPPPALPLPPPSPLRTRPAAPRSPPTRFGILESSPDHRSALKTRCSRLPTTSPGPPSGTSVHLPQTDPPQTAPPSTPHGSDTHAPPQLPRYTTPHSPPQAPAADVHPICRSACSRSAVQSVCFARLRLQTGF